MVGASAPVWSARRATTVEPPRLMMALASCVATISRRSLCRSIVVRESARPASWGNSAPARVEDRGRPARGSPAARRCKRELGIGEQHREFRPRQRLAAPLALASARPRRAGTRPRGRAGRAASSVCMRRRAKPRSSRPRRSRERDRQRLQVVVAQHEARRPRRSSRRAACRAPPWSSRPSRIGHRERDLDVHLDVGGVHAGRIVDGVGVEADARGGPPRCGRAGCTPRLAPSPIDLARATSAPVMRIASLARSPTSPSVSAAART